MKPRIFFVEDDPSILALQLALTRKLGYEPLSATDGEQALALIRRERPDVVVLDVMLPGCDGYALARRLREHPETADIPVAFVTARGEVSDFREGFASGGQVYLAKPFTVRALQTVIEGLLTQRTRTAPRPRLKA